MKKSDRTVVEDLPRSGQPSTSNIDGKVKEMVLKNRHISLKGYVVSASWLVPKALNFVQKQHREMVAEAMFSEANNDPTFMKRIITGNET